MANLNIQNLQNTIQSGNIESLFGGIVDQVPNEKVVLQEMKAESLPVPSSSTQSKTFSEIFKDSVEKVNEYQVDANRAIKELVAGRNKNIHETMLVMERADTSLKLMMQVRNKILDAYKEVMRMQI